MSFQYTYDANGKPVGVFVPITEWNKITNESNMKKTTTKTAASKEKILQGIEKGMKQVKRIEKGKLKSVSLKQLIDAL
ncbi:MAG TPA: hypothetical protein VIM07_15525 [Chitinophagaceae bacterium]|jgi:hypothetical protein